ncbi:MAG: metallophosphoesterase family protein [Methanomassiliicoccales archaeon]
MRILFFTDTHLRSVTPQNRTDNLPRALISKLEEVIKLAEEWSVDLLLHGGDLFDVPNPGLAQAGEYLAVLKRLTCPLYIVPGNHDLYGGNLLTLPRTLLGLLSRLGYLHLLLPESPIYVDDQGVRYCLSGQGYHYDIDHEPKGKSYNIVRQDADCFIHVVHGMLLERGGFPGEHTLIEELTSPADITLCGHYHLGFGVVERQGSLFVNPGALVRLTNHPMEINRRPSVALLHTDNGLKCDIIPLSSASPGTEVLSREAAELYLSRQRQLEIFSSEIKAAADMKKVNVERVLEDLLQENNDLAPEVKSEARLRLSRAEEYFAQRGGAR